MGSEFSPTASGRCLHRSYRCVGRLLAALPPEHEGDAVVYDSEEDEADDEEQPIAAAGLIFPRMHACMNAQRTQEGLGEHGPAVATRPL